MTWFRWLTTRPRGQSSWERGQHCMRTRTKPSPNILTSGPRWPRGPATWNRTRSLALSSCTSSTLCSREIAPSSADRCESPAKYRTVDWRQWTTCDSAGRPSPRPSRIPADPRLCRPRAGRGPDRRPRRPECRCLPRLWLLGCGRRESGRSFAALWADSRFRRSWTCSASVGRPHDARSRRSFAVAHQPRLLAPPAEDACKQYAYFAIKILRSTNSDYYFYKVKSVVWFFLVFFRFLSPFLPSTSRSHHALSGVGVSSVLHFAVHRPIRPTLPLNQAIGIWGALYIPLYVSFPSGSAQRCTLYIHCVSKKRPNFETV